MKKLLIYLSATGVVGTGVVGAGVVTTTIFQKKQEESNVIIKDSDLKIKEAEEVLSSYSQEIKELKERLAAQSAIIITLNAKIQEIEVELTREKAINSSSNARIRELENELKQAIERWTEETEGFEYLKGKLLIDSKNINFLENKKEILLLKISILDKNKPHSFKESKETLKSELTKIEIEINELNAKIKEQAKKIQDKHNKTFLPYYFDTSNFPKLNSFNTKEIFEKLNSVKVVKEELNWVEAEEFDIWTKDSLINERESKALVRLKDGAKENVFGELEFKISLKDDLSLILKANDKILQFDDEPDENEILESFKEKFKEKFKENSRIQEYIKDINNLEMDLDLINNTVIFKLNKEKTTDLIGEVKIQLEITNLTSVATEFSYYHISNPNNIFEVKTGLTGFDRFNETKSVVTVGGLILDSNFKIKIKKLGFSIINGVKTAHKIPTVLVESMPEHLDSRIESLEGLFERITLQEIPNISSWEVQNVKNMKNLFKNTQEFNQDLSRWDVSNVTNMEGMFFRAEQFNGNIKTWNVKNVENMEAMFEGAAEFNQDISGWNVRKVKNMNRMFASYTAFNQDISRWELNEKVTFIDFTTNRQDGTSFSPLEEKHKPKKFQNSNN